VKPSVARIAFLLLVSLAALPAQHPYWPKIWWKGCDLDVRYNSAWDEHGGVHIYENYYAGGWRVYEVTKFAESGDVCMQGILGFLYEHHTPANIVDQPPINHTLAAKWFRLAAEQGHGEAQEGLADAYWTGVGVRQDYVEAAKWYLKAADQGLPCAQLQLGEMYRDGQGIEKDDVQAHKWLNLAAADEVNLALTKELATDYCVDTARNERNTLAQTMTPAQIAEAQRQARIWKPNIPPDPIPRRTYNMDLGKGGRTGR
jgi:uncharacterized protein